MTRKKKLLLNTVSAILKQIVTVACGFILPRYFLAFYGSAVNGLVTSITNFLSFISLLDMGVGAVVQANLYKPLAQNDHDQVSMILKSSSRFFRKLALIFCVYMVGLVLFIPGTVSKSFDFLYTGSLIVIIAVSTFAQYFFGMTYQLLLNADQKSFVHLSIHIGTVVANTGFAVFLMKLGLSVHIVKISTSIIYLLRPFLQAIYVKHHYTIDRKIEVLGEPIKQKWNGFSQHMASVVCQNVDTVVLTLFSSLENVSIYSVYFNVTYGVEQVIMTAATGLEALFGNMIANGEDERLVWTFETIEWGIHTLVTLVFTVTAITIVPFVAVYTKGIVDVDYIVPIFGVIIVAAYGMKCLRAPYFLVVKAAGHFKETQNGAYISAGLNILFTITLVFRYGLSGAAAGTLVAMLYHTCYFVWYLRSHILNRPVKIFIRYICTDLAVASICFIGWNQVSFVPNNYLSWMGYAFVVFVTVSLVTAVCNFVLYRRQLRDCLSLFSKRVKRI